MTRLLAIGTTVFALILVAACVDRDNQKGQHGNQFGASPTPGVSPTPVSPTPEEATPPLHTVVSTPNDGGQTAPPKGELPYGIPVPGKPGYVFSPYAPNDGYVDVNGYAPGPRSGAHAARIFLVPDQQH